MKLNQPFTEQMGVITMDKIYGYARCSTNESRQDINRQKRELFKLGVQDERLIYWEYESGMNTNRVELLNLLEIIEQGDTIATTEVSRLTRSTKQLCDVMQIIQDKRIRLIIGGFIVDCRSDDIDPMTKGMLMMWGGFAEMERDIISQRVKSGMENAKLKGSKIGRPQLTLDKIPAKFLQYYPMLKKKEISISDLSRMLECSRTSIYKYIRLMEQD